MFSLNLRGVPRHESHIFHTEVLGKVTRFHFELAFPRDKCCERGRDRGGSVTDIKSDR